jgi:hypothetical protein
MVACILNRCPIRIIGRVIFAQWLLREGIASISSSPDLIISTWRSLAKNLP